MDLRSFTHAELKARVTALGEAPYRAEQVFRWLHGPAAAGTDPAGESSNLPRALRTALLEAAPLRPLSVDEVQKATDGTQKFRFRTHDGRAIESVLIPDRVGSRRPSVGAHHRGRVWEPSEGSHLHDNLERDRLTLCISSQVGCALDCRFCATATLGFGRHLSAGEIVEQVYHATAAAGRRPTNIVFMGMGEPLHNFDGVTRAFGLLCHPWGPAFSPRRITVSTVGLVPGIEALGKLTPAPNLAISLNATTDEVRDRLMPVNRKWPIATLLGAARKFPLAHHRNVTFEYVLLADVNDSDADAARLPRLLAGMTCKVNLIPWNPFPGPDFRRPAEDRIWTFQAALRAAGLPVYIRTPRGDDIDAACGQLAARTYEIRRPSESLSNTAGG